MRPTRSTLLSIVIGVLVAAVVSVAAIATGAAVADDGRAPAAVQACAKKSNGALRLMTGKTCTKKERKVVWAAQGLPGVTGAPGATGATGAAGAPGAAGSNGVSGYEVVTSSTDVSGTTAFFGGRSVTCPAGKKTVGGGARALGEGGSEVGSSTFTVRSSAPSADGTRWTAVVDMTGNGDGFVRTIVVRAVCMTAN